MHELSIAQSILELVLEHTPPGRKVQTVRVRIGEISGVVADSLEFCFSAVTQETPLSEARLEIEEFPFIVACSSCGKTSRSEPGIVLCPSCGSSSTTITSGTELSVAEIVLDDP
jgi:hydrogenase nickel incorporation protein HypA/HybF